MILESFQRVFKGSDNKNILNSRCCVVFEILKGYAKFFMTKYNFNFAKRKSNIKILVLMKTAPWNGKKNFKNQTEKKKMKKRVLKASV